MRTTKASLAQNKQTKDSQQALRVTPYLRLWGGGLSRGCLRGAAGHAGKRIYNSGTPPLIACLFIVLLASLLLVNGSPSIQAQELADSITVGRYYYISEWGGTNDAFFDKSSGDTLYCANQEMHAPSDGTVYTGGYVLNNPMVDYIMYHGYDGPVDALYVGDEAERDANRESPWETVDGRTFSRWGVFQGTRNAIWIARGTSSVYTEDDPRLATTNNDTWAYTRYIYYAAKAWVESGAQGPENGYAILWPSVDGGTTQAILSPRSKTAKLSLVKTCSIPELNDNSLYSLEGAVYGIFSDAQCTQEVATMTTNAEGSAHVDNLAASTYFVKELQPSKGMQLDPTVHKILLEGGSSGEVRSKELPLYDVPEFWLAKMDAVTGRLEPQGNASLEGAEFLIEYFENEDGSFNGEPARTWTVITDASGHAPFNESSIVGGSKPYKDTAGNLIAPLGSYRITETKAPRGYKLNSAVMSAHVVGSLGEIVDSYVFPTLSEEPIMGTGTVLKLDEDFHEALSQGAATLAGAQIAIISENEHVVEVDGVSYATGDEVCVLTTNADGSSNLSPKLPYGSYTAREITPPDGYKLNSVWAQSFDITSDGECVELELTDAVIRGGGRITKLDFDSELPQAQGDATLEGAELGIYNANNHPVLVNGKSYEPNEMIETILVTNAQGIAQTASSLLPYGNYLLREERAPIGYLLDEDWSATVAIFEQDQLADCSGPLFEHVIRGGVEFTKIDVERNETISQGDATLAGAQIAIYNTSATGIKSGDAWYAPTTATSRDELLQATPVITLTTDAHGYAATSTDALPYGSYVAIEISPSQGYLVNETWMQHFTITRDGELVQIDKLAENVIRGDVLFTKRDAETNKALPLGEATLAGTVFEIRNVSDNAVLVDGSLVAPTELVCTLTTNEVGIAFTSGGKLPYGTYSYEETQSPYGYLPTPGGSGKFSITEQGVCIAAADGSVVEMDNNGTPLNPDLGLPTAINQVIRGDLYFNKLDFETQQELAGVAFKITALATGESHIIVTDENGVFDSSNYGSGERTNSNDAAYTVINAGSAAMLDENDNLVTLGSFESGVIDDSLLNAHAGVWFRGRVDGGGEPNDALAAFPVGSYQIEELRCKANQGRSLIKGRTFTVSALARNNNKLYDLGTINNLSGPHIATTLTGEDDSHVVPVKPQLRLVDIVSFENLANNTSYNLVGELHVVENGNDAGVIARAHTIFEPTTKSGTVEVGFDVDTSQLAGKDLVAFEYLYELGESADDKPIATHEDPEDKGQTVTVEPSQNTPSVTTTFTDEHGSKQVSGSNSIVLIDTVSYEGLAVGETYTVTGSIIDKSSGDALQTPTGETILATVQLTPSSSAGTIDVRFELDAARIEGKTLVAFESLQREGVEICAHRDLTSEAQTVVVQKKGTPTKTPSTTPNTPTQRITGKLPRTGDELNPALIAILCLGALTVLSVGFFAQRHVSQQALGSTSNSLMSNSLIEVFSQQPKKRAADTPSSIQTKDK